MSYSLIKIYNDFKIEIEKINEIIIDSSNNPQDLRRDILIEGCFIRLVVSWERFIEEYFLRCMCGAKRRKQDIDIRPKNTPFRNIDEAFQKINKHRRTREKDYIDWLKVEDIQIRIDDYFRKNSRVQKICESPQMIYQLVVIRNAIAHRSESSAKKFEKFVKDTMGYLAPFSKSIASLLIQRNRRNGELIFTILSVYFLRLAETLTE